MSSVFCVFQLKGFVHAFIFLVKSLVGTVGMPHLQKEGFSVSLTCCSEAIQDSIYYLSPLMVFVVLFLIDCMYSCVFSSIDTSLTVCYIFVERYVALVLQIPSRQLCSSLLQLPASSSAN